MLLGSIRDLVLLFSILPVVYLKKSRGGDSMFKKSMTGGPVGKDGEKVVFCPAGSPGPPGPQGLPGRDGRDGRDLPLNGNRAGCPSPSPCPAPTPCPAPSPACANAVPERHSALGTEDNPAWSCQELFAANTQLNSGPYWLKTPHHEPYQVHCEMSRVEGADRGGWTLVARVDGDTNDFAGISPTWTNSDLINADESADLSKTGSMKNYGWGNIISNTLKTCFNGPRSSCAKFTHNKAMTLADLFKTQFAIETSEQYTFKTLMGKFDKTLDISKLKTEWCGINLGDLCSLAHPPSRYHGRHVCRIGCIGDSGGEGSEGGCHPQDYALGIGVAVCRQHRRDKRCTLTEDASKSLQYRTLNHKSASYKQTAFIYIR